MNPTNVSQPSSETVGAAPQRSAMEAAKESVKSSARSATADLRATATEAASRVKQQAADFVGQQRRGVADRLGGVSSAIHESAKSFEEQDPNIAWFTHQAADRLEAIAQYVRDRDFSSLRSDVESLARRNPAAFLGGLFVTGLVIGNVIKAAQSRSDVASTGGAPAEIGQEGAPAISPEPDQVYDSGIRTDFSSSANNPAEYQPPATSVPPSSGAPNI